MPEFLLQIPALSSLNDGLWPGGGSQISPSAPTCFWPRSFITAIESYAPSVVMSSRGGDFKRRGLVCHGNLPSAGLKAILRIGWCLSLLLRPMPNRKQCKEGGACFGQCFIPAAGSRLGQAYTDYNTQYVSLTTCFYVTILISICINTLILVFIVVYWSISKMCSSSVCLFSYRRVLKLFPHTHECRPCYRECYCPELQARVQGYLSTRKSSDMVPWDSPRGLFGGLKGQAQSYRIPGKDLPYSICLHLDGWS